MAIFDLVLHHGGRGLTKITDKSPDPIRDKLFRVVANVESKIVSVNGKNKLVIYNKLERLPKEAQDRIIDGTLIAKDGTYLTGRADSFKVIDIPSRARRSTQMIGDVECRNQRRSYYGNRRTQPISF